MLGHLVRLNQDGLGHSPSRAHNPSVVSTTDKRTPQRRIGDGQKGYTERVKKKPLHARVRKPMPRKPPKVEVPKTEYRRRPKHPKPIEAE